MVFVFIGDAGLAGDSFVLVAVKLIDRSKIRIFFYSH
jgi:hypothetical protein